MGTTPSIDYDPTSPHVQADPYPYYARLREHAPLQWNEHIHAWVVSRHPDVVEMLRDSRWSSNYIGRGVDLALRKKLDIQRLGQVLLFMDAPDHTKLRRAVSKGFESTRLAQLAVYTRATATQMLDDFRGRDEVDLISEFAAPLSLRVLARLLGVPDSDLSVIEDSAHDLSRLVDWTPSVEALDGVRKRAAILAPYLRNLIEHKRREPGDDLISTLIEQIRQHKMRYVDIISTTILLLAAGHVTSTHMIGNGVLALLKDPKALEECRSERYPMVRVVEELLRYDSPVQATPRSALEDIELHGQVIRRGEIGLALLGSANRDPSAFVEPDRIDPGRRNVFALSFGSGPHFCIGAELGRATGAIALEFLLGRYPNLRLADQVLKWTPTVTQHGLTALRVAL